MSVAEQEKQTTVEHAADAALSITRCLGYCSPDGTHYTLMMGAEGDTVTATLSDGTLVHAVERDDPGRFIFLDGEEMQGIYNLVAEEHIFATDTRRPVPHFIMTSRDYLVLELANVMVRTKN